MVFNWSPLLFKRWISKRHIRFRGSIVFNNYIKKLSYGDNVTVWDALNLNWIIWQFSFNDEFGDAETINSDGYLFVLSVKFIPALPTKGINCRSILFQHDTTCSCACHFINWADNWRHIYLFFIKKRRLFDHLICQV